MEFNKTVGSDHFTHKWAQKDFDFLNVLCWGASKMMVEYAPEKTARATRVRLWKIWCKPFGLMVDRGPEFGGDEFYKFFM